MTSVSKIKFSKIGKKLDPGKEAVGIVLEYIKNVKFTNQDSATLICDVKETDRPCG